MQIPWLTRPPTVQEVAAHAKAYPTSVSDIGFPESSAQAGSCDAAGTAHSWEITIRGVG